MKQIDINMGSIGNLTEYNNINSMPAAIHQLRDGDRMFSTRQTSRQRMETDKCTATHRTDTHTSDVRCRDGVA